MAQVRDLIRVGPYQEDHFPALRGALGIAIPLLVLVIVGRPDLVSYAIFGAFTGVYGRLSSYRERLITQLRVGATMAVSVSLALLSAYAHVSEWTLVLFGALAAGAFAVVAVLLRFGGVGGFFVIFGFLSVSHMPHPANFGEALGVNLAASVLAVLLGLSGRILRPGKRPWTQNIDLPPIEVRRLVTLAARYFIATAVAGTIATGLHIGHSYWAMLSAAVVMAGLTRWNQVVRGAHRIIGTFIGLGVYAVLSLLSLGEWQTVAVLLVLEFLTELLVIRHYGIAMIFITPMALLMTTFGLQVNTTALVADRAVETVVGVAVGVLVALLTHDDVLGRFQRRQVTRELS